MYFEAIPKIDHEELIFEEFTYNRIYLQEILIQFITKNAYLAGKCNKSQEYFYISYLREKKN